MPSESLGPEDRPIKRDRRGRNQRRDARPLDPDFDSQKGTTVRNWSSAWYDFLHAHIRVARPRTIPRKRRPLGAAATLLSILVARGGQKGDAGGQEG